MENKSILTTICIEGYSLATNLVVEFQKFLKGIYSSGYVHVCYLGFQLHCSLTHVTSRLQRISFSCSQEDVFHLVSPPAFMQPLILTIKWKRKHRQWRLGPVHESEEEMGMIQDQQSVSVYSGSTKHPLPSSFCIQRTNTPLYLEHPEYYHLVSIQCDIQDMYSTVDCLVRM